MDPIASKPVIFAATYVLCFQLNRSFLEPKIGQPEIRTGELTGEPSLPGSNLSQLGTAPVLSFEG